MLISSEADLQNLHTRIKESGTTFIVLDTEFIRQTTYHPIVGLIQIAFQEDAYLIDPRAKNFHAPSLVHLLCDETYVKVLHSARQDYEIFYKNYSCIPKPLFDTQIAASLVGFRQQIGLAELVEALLGQTINKHQQHTNWLKRPLTPAQLSYAQLDVLLGIQIYPLLHRYLETDALWEQLHQCQSKLLNPSLYVPIPSLAWKKVKQHKALAPPHQEILKILAQWREQRAIEQNYNRQRILKDAALITLAQNPPTTVDALMECLPHTPPMILIDLIELLDIPATLPEIEDL